MCAANSIHRLRSITLLSALTICSTLACNAGPTAPDSKEASMSINERPPRSSSRMRSPEVPAIERAGIRYEQLRAPSSEGLAPGGYVTATEISSGKRLWLTRLYEIQLDPHRETDVQIVFLRSMTVSESGDSLQIVDEKGRAYILGMRDGVLQPTP